MSIYVITHKKFTPIVKDDFYKNLLVGVDNGNQGEKNYLKDNSNDNISKKNASFCELTGMYWLWKNSNDAIIGITHYRRYFLKRRFSKKFLSEKNIKKNLKIYDIILPKKSYLDGLTMKDQFKKYHSEEIWKKCGSIIANDCPEYIEDWKWLEKEKKGYFYNMLICNKQLYDSYCEWVFAILFKLEDITDLSTLDAYNQRMYGFISERLLNVWIHHNNLKIKEMPVELFDGRTLLQKGWNKIKSKL